MRIRKTELEMNGCWHLKGFKFMRSKMTENILKRDLEIGS